MKTKKIEKKFWLVFIAVVLFIFLFWTFAYFKTENKPIFVPLYVKIDLNNYWLLLPLALINYWLVFKTLSKKKFSLKLVLVLGISLIILLNSLKSDFFFYSPLKNPNNYYHDALKILNVKKFLFSFDQRIFFHRLHTRTHPPGPVLLHYFLNKLVPNQLIFNSLALIGLSSLTFFIVYKIAAFFKIKNKNLLTLLFFSSPGILLYSATCMDMIFALLISASIYSLLKLTKKVSFKNIVFSGVVIFLASFFHYAAIIIPLFSLLFLILGRFKDKKFFYSQFFIAVFIIFFHAILYFISGFRLMASLKASNGYNTMQNPDFFMTPKRYIFAVSANFVEYIVFLGLPIFALFLLNFFSLSKKRKTKFRQKYYFSFLAPLIIFNFLGVFKSTGWTGETGRVWLFLTPLIIAGLRIKDRKTLKLAALLSFIQSLIMQLGFNTFW